MPTISSTPAAVDLDRAADFLSAIANGQDIALSCIVPDGPIRSKIARLPEQRQAVLKWLAEHSGTANLYYSLNNPKPKAERVGREGKLTEGDVASIRGVAIDLDPVKAVEATEGGYERERTRLLALADEWNAHNFAPPSIIVDSGNGLQMIWLFSDQLQNDEAGRDAVKAQARGIGKLFGSDSIYSVDHLLRIPFTENLPKKSKRDKGRGRSTARLLRYDKGAGYSLDTLSIIAAPIAERAVSAPASAVSIDYNAVLSTIGKPEDLPPHLAARVETLRAGWPRLDELLAGAERSERDFAIAARLIEEGLTDPTELAQVVFALAPDKAEARGADYATRTVTNALAKTKPRPVATDWFQPTDHDVVPAATPRTPCVVSDLVDVKALPVREWIVAPRLPAGDVAQLVGEPGTSKSTFVIRDGLAVATGREEILRGADANGGPISAERLHRSGSVIIYNAEDRLSEMQRRLAVAQRHHNVVHADLKHDIILWSGVDHGSLKIMHRENDRAPLKRAPGADELERLIRKHGVVLAVLDPQISLVRGGRENDNDDQDALMQELAVMASRLGLCINVVHHTSKASRGMVGDIGAGRGGLAAVGKVRSAGTLTHVTGKGPGEDAWNATPADGLIRFDYSKVSHDRKPTEPIVFRRVSVAVGNGTGGAAGSASAMFNRPPREALLQDGDWAPILELVDHRGLMAATAAGSEVKDKAKVEAIARIADELLAGVDRTCLSELWAPIGHRMRDAGLGTAKVRNSVTAHITSALGGTGVAFNRDGQNVRVRVLKDSPREKAPWWVVRTIETTPAEVK